MQKIIYKVLPPKHINEKQLAQNNIATLTNTEIEVLMWNAALEPDPRTGYGPIYPRVGQKAHTVTINGLAQPQGEICNKCLPRVGHTSAQRAKKCLYNLAKGRCINPHVQNILGKTLFPLAQYDEKQRAQIQKNIQEIIFPERPQIATPEMDLCADLGMDSYDIYAALRDVEHEYKFEIPDSYKPQTVGDIIDYVHRKICKQR